MTNIDLSQEQIGTVFYTRDYSEAKLIGHICGDLYRFEVGLFNSFDDPQIISTKTSTGIYVIPDMESVAEYIKTATERQVKHDFGNDYKIANFVITEITPL